MEFNNGVISFTNPVITITISGMIFILLMTLVILLVAIVKNGSIKNLKIGIFGLTTRSKESESESETPIKDDKESQRIEDVNFKEPKCDCKDCKNYYKVVDIRRDTTNVVLEISKIKYIEHYNRSLILINSFINNLNDLLYEKYVVSLCKSANNIEDLLKINEYHRISYKLNDDIRKYLNNRVKENGLDKKNPGFFDNLGVYSPGSWDVYKDSVIKYVKSIYVQFVSGEARTELYRDSMDIYKDTLDLWDSDILEMVTKLLEDLRSVSIEIRESINSLVKKYELDESDFL